MCVVGREGRKHIWNQPDRHWISLSQVLLTLCLCLVSVCVCVCVCVEWISACERANILSILVNGV